LGRQNLDSHHGVPNASIASAITGWYAVKTLIAIERGHEYTEIRAMVNEMFAQNQAYLPQFKHFRV